MLAERISARGREKLDAGGALGQHDAAARAALRHGLAQQSDGQLADAVAAVGAGDGKAEARGIVGQLHLDTDPRPRPPRVTRLQAGSRT